MQQLGSAPYSFDFFISFGWVVIFLLLGAVLRMKVPLFQRYLIPGCMLGGLLGTIFVNSGITSFLGSFAPDFKALEGIIYHIYNLTFVAIGFMNVGSTSRGKSSNSLLKNTFRDALLSTTATYMQSVLGILTIVIFNIFMGTQLLESAGILVSRAFVGGPGYAMSTGAAYQQAGYTGMVSLGLSFAAVGYVLSIILGVPVANMIMRKRGIEGRGVVTTKAERRGVYEPGTAPEAGKLTFMGTNIDTLSFHICFLILCYLGAYTLLMGIGAIGFFSPRGMAMIWSLFAPLFCLPMGLIGKTLILGKVFKAGHLFDTGVHNRVLNTMIDLVAVAALVGIQIKVLVDWLPVLIVASILAGLGTMLFLYVATKNNLEFAEERFLGLLGLCTGTVTSGLVLVRMIDPEYKSTVPYELGFMAVISLAISLPLMPIITPLGYAQVFYQKSWTVPFFTYLAGLIGFGIIVFILSRIIDKKKVSDQVVS